MLVKVIIKRHFKEGTETDFLSLLKKMRFAAMNQEGYISGETLVSTDNPQKVIIISSWQSKEDWASWISSDTRTTIDSELQKLQVEPSAYEPYVFHKYRLAVKKGFPKITP